MGVYHVIQQCPVGKNKGACDWYTIYHHYLLQKRAKQAPLLINQPMGIWDIYECPTQETMLDDG